MILFAFLPGYLILAGFLYQVLRDCDYTAAGFVAATWPMLVLGFLTVLVVRIGVVEVPGWVLGRVWR